MEFAYSAAIYLTIQQGENHKYVHIYGVIFLMDILT